MCVSIYSYVFHLEHPKNHCWPSLIRWTHTCWAPNSDSHPPDPFCCMSSGVVAKCLSSSLSFLKKTWLSKCRSNAFIQFIHISSYSSNLLQECSCQSIDSQIHWFWCQKYVGMQEFLQPVAKKYPTQLVTAAKTQAFVKPSHPAMLAPTPWMKWLCYRPTLSPIMLQWKMALFLHNGRVKTHEIWNANHRDLLRITCLGSVWSNRKTTNFFRGATKSDCSSQGKYLNGKASFLKK